MVSIKFDLTTNFTLGVSNGRRIYGKSFKGKLVQQKLKG